MKAPSPDTTGRRRIDPQPTGLFIAMAGLCFTGWGIWIGVPASISLGGVLLAGWLFDLIVLVLANPWKHVHVTRRIEPRPIQAGQTIEVQLNISQCSAWSVGWQGCEDLTPWDDEWVVADRNELTRSPAGSRWLATYHVKASWRGVFKIGPLILLASSPLGFWRGRSSCRLRSGLVVWPTTVPMTISSLAMISSETSSSIGLPQPHLDDTTLREYQPGDDLHRIHWRSLARSNTLLTRAEEPSNISQTVGMLWTGGDADPSLVDLGIGLLASWADAMARSGQGFALALGARWMTQPSHQEMMDALAAVNESELRETAPASGRQSPDAVILVAIAGPSDKQIDVPDIAHSGVAVILASPSVAVNLPHDWDLLRLPPSVNLQTAASALQQWFGDHRGAAL